MLNCEDGAREGREERENIEERQRGREKIDG